ncbi:MAG: hypothetical protein FWE88_09120 [Phycisphaerae bacterium]|nr:hypothetical protein [Phycisphaerae bacterium]
MFRGTQIALVLGLLSGVLALTASLSVADDGPAKNAPAGNRLQDIKPITRDNPNDSLDFWLNQATTQSAGEAVIDETPHEPIRRDRGPRPDALPGVVELSNGMQMPGLLYTTRGKNLELYVEADRNWYRIPFIAVLGITTIVDEEAIELVWRWRAMGVDERVFTGESYPTRRFSYAVTLIDGSTMKGAIKGQPLWINLDGMIMGPLVLHERTKGKLGETLDDIIYVQKVVVSQRMMNAVIKEWATNPAASQPASRPAGNSAKKPMTRPAPQVGHSGS